MSSHYSAHVFAGQPLPRTDTMGHDGIASISLVFGTYTRVIQQRCDGGAVLGQDITFMRKSDALNEHRERPGKGANGDNDATIHGREGKDIRLKK